MQKPIELKIKATFSNSTFLEITTITNTVSKSFNVNIVCINIYMV